MDVDPVLYQFCNDRQREFLESLAETGSARATARAFGVHHSAVQRAYSGAKKKAAAQGYSPEHGLKHVIPEPFVAKGHSTYYDRDGVIRQQWVKSRLDDQAYLELIKEAVVGLVETVPRAQPITAPEVTRSSLANLYVLTDAHINMLAWHREGGVNWDLKIAENTISGCFDMMMAKAPDAKLGMIAQLGDLFHSDGLVPITPQSGHVVDQDGRFAKVVPAGVRLIRRLVDTALQKHERVVLLLAEGNHDQASSVWLQVLFKTLYENEPRVEVIDSPLPYYAVQHGKTALYFHHGHMKKTKDLPLFFASQFPAIWGTTTKRYGHTGHRHHETVMGEESGVKMTQHPTMAARDAYSARGGWMSERQASVTTYHSEYGKVSEYVVTPEMLS